MLLQVAEISYYQSIDKIKCKIGTYLYSIIHGYELNTSRILRAPRGAKISESVL